jgi:hypothetical protein
MQIHELNQPRKSQVNEIDLVGPGSIFNVGREVLKNPKAFTSSTALAAAQQAAAQTSAAKSAAKLASQGYQVGASVPAPVTLPQALQTVMQNPAVQQMVNNLTAQWQAQAPAVIDSVRMTHTAKMASAANTRRNVPEAVVINNPRTTKDPQDRQLLAALDRQEAARVGATNTAPVTSAAPAASNSAAPDSADMAAVDTQLQDVASAFTRWSDSKLATRGITMDSIRNDPKYKQSLNDQLTKIAIQSLADPKSPAATQAINTYFNTAIAAIQAEVNNRKTATAPATTSPQGGTAVPADAEILTLVQRQGFSVTKAELEELGKIMTASTGSNVVRSTGNPVLDALARLAGMRVA